MITRSFRGQVTSPLFSQGRFSILSSRFDITGVAVTCQLFLRSVYFDTNMQ